MEVKILVIGGIVVVMLPFKKVLKSRFCQDFKLMVVCYFEARFCQDFKLMVVCYFEALFAKSGFYIK